MEEQDTHKHSNRTHSTTINLQQIHIGTQPYPSGLQAQPSHLSSVISHLEGYVAQSCVPIIKMHLHNGWGAEENWGGHFGSRPVLLLRKQISIAACKQVEGQG
jgi:hypothetical protein